MKPWLALPAGALIFNPAGAVTQFVQIALTLYSPEALVYRSAGSVVSGTTPSNAGPFDDALTPISKWAKVSQQARRTSWCVAAEILPAVSNWSSASRMASRASKKLGLAGGFGRERGASMGDRPDSRDNDSL